MVNAPWLNSKTANSPWHQTLNCYNILTRRILLMPDCIMKTCVAFMYHKKVLAVHWIYLASLSENRAGSHGSLLQTCSGKHIAIQNRYVTQVSAIRSWLDMNWLRQRALCNKPDPVPVSKFGLAVVLEVIELLYSLIMKKYWKYFQPWKGNQEEVILKWDQYIAPKDCR